MNITELTNPDCQHGIINCHVELLRPEEAIFALAGSCLLLLFRYAETTDLVEPYLKLLSTKQKVYTVCAVQFEL